MRPLRRRWLAALVLLLAAGPAGAAGTAGSETPSFQAPVAPVRTPVQLQYGPFKGSYVYGSVLIEHAGTMSGNPKHRISGALRIERVREQLAVTFDIDGDKGKAGGDATGPRTIRMLITPKGQLLDAVMADETGKSDSRDNRLLLAQFAQEFFLMFPRFPDRPVATGDKLFDYPWDLGRMIGAPPGLLVVQVSGTVRGTASVQGRSVLVVDYEARGRCRCEGTSFLEQGYELVDLATGIVSATAGHARMDTSKGFSTWSSGASITFR